MRIYADLYPSDKESTRRAMFMLSSSKGGSSSSASRPQTSHAAAVEQSELPPGTDTTMVDGDEAIGAPPLPHPSEAAQVVPLPPVGQPSVETSLSPSMPPQVFESPQFVSPQEIFVPHQSLEAGPPIITPRILEHVQTASPSQVFLPPIARESPLVTPAVTPNQIVVSPVVTAPSSPVILSSVLGLPQAVAPHQVVISPAVATPPLVFPSILGSSQTVNPHQVVASPVVTASPLVPQEPASQCQITVPPSQVIPSPRATVAHHSPDLAGSVSGSFGPTVTTTSGYKPQAGTTTSIRSRRDSIDGAPDIILSLGASGYELAAPSSQLESGNNLDTPATITPSSPDEPVIPSSQRSLEEFLTIPMENQASTPEVSKTTTAASNHFFYAPRVVPDYNIDRSDLPSWLLERERLDYILSVEAGELWEKLIATWLRQERRLGFGLSEQLVGGTASLCFVFSNSRL